MASATASLVAGSVPTSVPLAPLGTYIGGFSGSISVSAAQSGAGTTIAVTSSLTPPANVPAINYSALDRLYVTLQANAPLTFGQPPTLTIFTVTAPVSTTPTPFNVPGSYTALTFNSAIASCGFQYVPLSQPFSLAPGQIVAFAYFYVIETTPTPPRPCP